MNIVSLKIKNFMSISDAELKLGQINQIVGMNSQGKTSILKAIEAAVEGSTDGKLVRFGEEQAEIVLELPEQTTISRRIKADGKQSVSVKRGDFSAPKPQEFLEGLFAVSAFNPLDLLEPKKRAEAIMKSIELNVTAEFLAKKLNTEVKDLPPVDFGKHGLEVIDDVYKFYYQRRAEANKDAATKKSKWTVNKEGFVAVEAPAVSQADITNQRHELIQKKNSIDAELGMLKTLSENNDKALARVKNYSEAVAKIEAEIENLDEEHEAAVKKLVQEKEVKLAKLTTRLSEGKKFIEIATEEIKEGLPSSQPFLDELKLISQKFAEIDVTEQKVKTFDAASRTQNMIAELEADYTKAQSFAETLTSRLDQFAAIKEEVMAASEMPVKGLKFEDGAFTVAGTPIDNLSSSMALRLAVAVARKLSKKTKIICIDGAERLDENTYGELLAEIKDDGFTYFITKVGTGSPDANIITMKSGSVQ